MEDALAQLSCKNTKKPKSLGLNPCFNGRCTRTLVFHTWFSVKRNCLNPCFNGRCTRTESIYMDRPNGRLCLNPCFNGRCTRTRLLEVLPKRLGVVLILVLMEDALALSCHPNGNTWDYYSLNPCFNGRCTRTSIYPPNKLRSQCLNPCFNGRCTRTTQNRY